MFVEFFSSSVLIKTAWSPKFIFAEMKLFYHLRVGIAFRISNDVISRPNQLGVSFS